MSAAFFDWHDLLEERRGYGIESFRRRLHSSYNRQFYLAGAFFNSGYLYYTSSGFEMKTH